MKKVRYAVVGNGWISQEAFMPGVNQTGNSVIAAIVSGNRKTAEKLAKFHRIPAVHDYKEYDKLLKSGAIDAVYIALPNSLHADYAMRAAKAGIHALVEKPLATTIKESNAMIAAAKKNKTFLSTAYRLHADEPTLKLYDLVRSGAIGEPKLFTSVFGFQINAGNHRLLSKHWGGALQDIGVYCVNAMRHIFAAEPVTVTALDSMGQDDKRFKQVPATVSALMNFGKGRIATFQCSFGVHDSDTYTVTGSSGQIVLQNAYRFNIERKMEITRGGKTETLIFPAHDDFSGQTAYFSDCILSKKRPEPDGEDGLADMMVMLAIEKAVRTGKTQKLKIPRRKTYAEMSQHRSFPVATHRLVDV
jgi:predicted dehydrogenase